LGSQCIGAKEKSAPLATVRIDQQINVVVLPQHAVAFHLVGHDLARLRIETLKANIQFLPIEQDPDDRLLGSWMTFIWALLNKAADRFGCRPSQFVELPVDYNRCLCPMGISRSFLTSLRLANGCVDVDNDQYPHQPMHSTKIHLLVSNVSDEYELHIRSYYMSTQLSVVVF